MVGAALEHALHNVKFFWKGDYPFSSAEMALTV